jgi:hypothetical protein
MMSKNADTAGQKENTAPGVPVEHPPLDSRSDTRVAGLPISKRLTGLVAFSREPCRGCRAGN